MTARRHFPLISLSLIVGVGLALLTSCSKKEQETEPEVTVQAAKAERQSIRQIIRSEAVLFPRNQAAITPKIVAPVKKFYVNRGSRVHAGQLLAVLENRDLAATETENKGSYQQAEANYGIETSSALPEEWQKAEYDLKAAKESYDSQQKVYEIGLRTRAHTSRRKRTTVSKLHRPCPRNGRRPSTISKPPRSPTTASKRFMRSD